MIAARLLSSSSSISSSSSSSSLSSSTSFNLATPATMIPTTTNTKTTTTTMKTMKTEQQQQQQQQVRTLIPVTASDGSKLFVSGPCIVLKTQQPGAPAARTVGQQMQALRPLLKADINVNTNSNNNNNKTRADSFVAVNKHNNKPNDNNNNATTTNTTTTTSTTTTTTCSFKKNSGGQTLLLSNTNTNNLENEPELLRCKRRIDFSTLGLPKPQPAAMARRNERERNRVKQVNLGFDTLRQHVPQGRKNKKLSKVDTLKEAVRYIGYLRQLLKDAQEDEEGGEEGEREGKEGRSLGVEVGVGMMMEEEDEDGEEAEAEEEKVVGGGRGEVLKDTVAGFSHSAATTTVDFTGSPPASSSSSSSTAQRNATPELIMSLSSSVTDTTHARQTSPHFVTMTTTTTTTPGVDGSSSPPNSSSRVDFPSQSTTAAGFAHDFNAMDFSSRENPVTEFSSRETNVMEFSGGSCSTMEFSSVESARPNSARSLPHQADFGGQIHTSPTQFGSLDYEAAPGDLPCSSDDANQFAQFATIQDLGTTTLPPSSTPTTTSHHHHLHHQHQQHNELSVHSSAQDQENGSPCNFLELGPAQMPFGQHQRSGGSLMDIDSITLNLEPGRSGRDLASFHNNTSFHQHQQHPNHHVAADTALLNYMQFSGVAASSSSSLPRTHLHHHHHNTQTLTTTSYYRKALDVPQLRPRGSSVSSCPVSPCQSSGASAGEESPSSSGTEDPSGCLVVSECETWQDLSADIAEWLCSKIDIDDPDVFV